MSENIYASFHEHVLDVLKKIIPDLPENILKRVELVPTRELAHGDMATNAAMVAAKAAGRKPQEIAGELAAGLCSVPAIKSAEVAGPGFVNITLEASVFLQLIPTILARKEQFGHAETPKNLVVNVEYVSANPTGPMHVGHCRGAVVGDVLANILHKAGYKVTKEYYINDAGTQVNALAWAAYWRYLQAIGLSISDEVFEKDVPGGLQYKGDYLIEVGEALKQKYDQSLAPEGKIAPVDLWFAPVKEMALDYMMARIRQDLSSLGVYHEVFTSEAAVLAGGAVEIAINKLQAKGLLYTGILPPPKGKQLEEWEERPQLLFKATQFGDDVDRALRKADGSNTYFANDIGYHNTKIQQGADIVIDVLGADHGGYVARMRAAVKALSHDRPADKPVDFEAVICQIVRVVRNGQPVKMSKRAGTFVTLHDLIDEVGKDAVRFTMLTRKADAQMDFDLDQVVAHTRDNPVFYVQYAHARCCSILRSAQDVWPDILLVEDASPANLLLLNDEAEMNLIKHIAQWPRLVEAAAATREPHRVAFYLMDLAAFFHGLWNRGKDNTQLRFIQSDDYTASLPRIMLVMATAIVLRSGFAVLGVDPVEEM
ncbi:arginine--tRNA ligase [Entomobacter blattae]|uniref:Arginine--tRNA ligase n=1 Tax=Entomobacter blattae TaxID=2762277 RepID=A0A7H1NUB5_9PROT|nr:arginine--tRNA ligase [Entomobacter blattae]QNT79375.1 Arginine--tRNA ligase [Entomobacter blattae]